jgi:MerR family transcriptional regulator, redox-sensitive transcriptional activator SoxR
VATMSIGEVATLTGLSQSAIRYYESEGLIAAPARRGGKRDFAPEVVDAVRVIRMARDLGFSVEDIRTLLNGFSANTAPPVVWQELARRKLPEVNELIQRASAMKRLLEKGLRCNCVTVQDCILYDCNPPVQLKRGNAAPPASV